MGKSFFSAIIGAVIGGAIMVGLGKYGVHALWPALGVGVVCGVIMRMNVHPAGGSYLNGALAAVALLLAVVGGKYALISVLGGGDTTEVGARAAAPAEEPPADPAGDEEPGEAEEPVEDPEASMPAPVVLEATPTLTAAPRGMEVSAVDGLYLVISALIAYQIGKGEGGAKPKQEEDAAGGGQPAPEGEPEPEPQAQP